MSAQCLAQFEVGAWTLTVHSATGGAVTTVTMTATHRDGRAERFDVGAWPAGWRILRLGLTIPRSVRKAAIRLAEDGTGSQSGVAA